MKNIDVIYHDLRAHKEICEDNTTDIIEQLAKIDEYEIRKGIHIQAKENGLYFKERNVRENNSYPLVKIERVFREEKYPAMGKWQVCMAPSVKLHILEKNNQINTIDVTDNILFQSMRSRTEESEEYPTYDIMKSNDAIMHAFRFIAALKLEMEDLKNVVKMQSNYIVGHKINMFD